MNREPVALRSDLLAWLRRDHVDPAPGWEPEPPAAELHCRPELIARLAEAARAVTGTRRRFVGGCPVIEHPRGRPIAAAAGASWSAVRSDLAAGGLQSGPLADAEIGPGWVELDPWSADVAFARARDLLRAHVARAYEIAETETATDTEGAC